MRESRSSETVKQRTKLCAHMWRKRWMTWLCACVSWKWMSRVSANNQSTHTHTPIHIDTHRSSPSVVNTYKVQSAKSIEHRKLIRVRVRHLSRCSNISLSNEIKKTKHSRKVEKKCQASLGQIITKMRLLLCNRETNNVIEKLYFYLFLVTDSAAIYASQIQ